MADQVEGEERWRVQFWQIKYSVAVVIMAASLYHIHTTPKTTAYSTDVIVLFGVLFYVVFSALRKIGKLFVRAAVIALFVGAVYYYRSIQWSTIAILCLAALF